MIATLPHVHARLTLVVLAALLYFGASPSLARVPTRGSDAPKISLDDLGGTRVDTSNLQPRALVLIFGEIGQDTTLAACTDVLTTLADPRVAADSVVPILITAQSTPAATLRDEAAKGRYPAIILRDPQRDAFGAYKVLVLPTAVVVDSKGKVVHAVPGHFARFKDTINGAVQAATGKQTLEQFDHSMQATAVPANPEAQRADRLVHLGQELLRHNLDDMAQARFAEALALMPTNTDAKLGLASLALKRDTLPEAESLFRSVLSAAPDSVEGTLGLAAVHLKRAGDDLPKGETLVRSLLEKNPKEARARYLLGQFHERKGDFTQAANEYKKALDTLFDRPMFFRETP